ncbi:MAG TPA: glycosyltransferase N-terminal domain-containing protein [Thermoanaerobaculia bacterium]
MRLYRALAALALAAYAPFAILRSLTGGRRLGDLRGRLGRRPYPRLDGGIWIHAVSVGEIGVAGNLLRALRRRLPDPACPIGISVTTAAGRELAVRTLSAEAAVFAFPFELAGAVERALGETRPSLVVLIETEIWPLFLERAAARSIRVALVNGRISSRSFARYRRIRGFLSRSLSRIALFAMQSREDADRIEAIGAPPERVRDLGNLKYDLPEAPVFPDAERLRRAASGRAVLVAGSTGEGEEELVLDAWAGLAPRPLLVLAPRRPERFDSVARLCASRRLSALRRSTSDSRLPTTDSPVDVYLLDSIGELASAYRGAAVAFVGGSLVATGGQNPIEAWAAGVPAIAGPHMENFREIAARGESLGILERARDSADLARRLAAALCSPDATSRRGAEAARFVAENRGAAERAADALLALVPGLALRRVREGVP